MMDKQNKAKSAFLGEAFSTARARLIKQILFSYAVKCGDNICYRCKSEISNILDLSIEHKEPWFGVNINLFWNLENVAFSHIKCNSGAGRRPTKKIVPEGESWCTSHQTPHPISEFSPNGKPNINNGLHHQCKEIKKEFIRDKRSMDKSYGRN